MFIIGINAYHGDSSACLLHNGRLLSAVEEERFTRIKHWAGFPVKAIAYCLEDAGISLKDVEIVAINTKPRANLMRKLAFTAFRRPDIRFLMDRLENKHQRASVASELLHAFPEDRFKGRVLHIEHHLSHIASSHYVSPFDKSVSVSVDGFGDFSSAAWGLCKGRDIHIDKRVYFPHSLGIFYQALTQFLGFPHYGDEYKVMGLAPYGDAVFLPQMRKILHLETSGAFELNLEYFRHHVDKVDYEWKGGIPVIGKLFNQEKMEELFGLPVRESDEQLSQVHKNIAHSAQAMYEEAFFNIVNAAHGEYGTENLTLSGGCAMNSVANGKVYKNTPFKHVYIQSAAGDAGGAIGAAFQAWVENGGTIEFTMDHSYWGPQYNNDQISELLAAYESELNAHSCSLELVKDERVLCDRTANSIAAGQVVGWFQGRMEWGPRALGNRSILGDPRRADMKDILNLKIKRRESFRPFAPSILREAVPEWFETEDDVPFMMQVFRIHETKREAIPAVTHVDGSGRLQTVHEDTNPRYYHLIERFRELTGVPLVLNTSFNENEPVVCRPSEALECFLRTKMDVLVLGDYFIHRGNEARADQAET